MDRVGKGICCCFHVCAALVYQAIHITMLLLISQELGTPSEEIWPGYNELPFVKKVLYHV